MQPGNRRPQKPKAKMKVKKTKEVQAVAPKIQPLVEHVKVKKTPVDDARHAAVSTSWGLYLDSNGQYIYPRILLCEQVWLVKINILD